jgi:hypothetical protein
MTLKPPSVPTASVAPFAIVLLMCFVENFVFAVTKDYICLLGSLIGFLSLVAPLVLLGSHQDQLFFTYTKYGLPAAMLVYPVVLSIGLGKALQSVLVFVYVAPMSAMFRRTLEGRIVLTQPFLGWLVAAMIVHLVCTIADVAGDAFKEANRLADANLIDNIDATHGLVAALAIFIGPGFLLTHSHRVQSEKARRAESVLSALMKLDPSLAAKLHSVVPMPRDKSMLSGSTVNIFDSVFPLPPIGGPGNVGTLVRNPMSNSVTAGNPTNVTLAKGSSDETLSSIASSTMNTLTSFGLPGGSTTAIVAYSPTSDGLGAAEQINWQIPGVRSATVLAIKARSQQGASITQTRHDVEALLEVVGRTPIGRAIVHGDLNNMVYIVWTMSVSRDSVLAAMNTALTIAKDVRRSRIGSEMSGSGSSSARPHSFEPPAIGIAQGTTMLGEFGVGLAKGIRVLGNVVQRAQLLTQLAEYHSIGIVCDSDSAGYAEHEFVTKPLDIVSTTAHAVDPITVYEVVKRLDYQGVGREGIDWQYELDMIEQTNPMTDLEYREGFRLVQEHQYEEAAAMFAQHCASNPGDTVALKMHKRCLQLAETARLLPAEDLKNNKWHARVVQPPWAPVQGESEL